VNNSIRRHTRVSRDAQLEGAATEEPPSSRATRSPLWNRLTKKSQYTDQIEVSTNRWLTWANDHRDLMLRYTAHGVVLVAITATLGLSHVRLTDIRLPSLTAPTSSQLVRVADDAALIPSDSESYFQRMVVPRTASAIRISLTPADGAALAPREEFAPARSVEAPPSTRGTSVGITKAEDIPTPPEPTLDALIGTYVVEQGDTLLAISYKYDISLEALVAANPFLKGSFNTIFHPGDELIIPPPGGILHHVQEGDTLETIAESYKVTVQDIVSYGPNRVSSNSQLAPTQRVFVPQGAVELRKAEPVQAKTPTNTLVSVLQPKAPVTNPAPAPAPARPAPPAAPIVGTGSLRTPLYGYMVTQQFWAYHNGVDLAAPMGTPVYAADAGRVIWSGWDNWGYGYMLLIDHGNGIRTRYAHNSWIFPSYGDYVTKGQQIAKVGSTGRSSGPHLHFEVIVGGIARNPFNYIR
jgi:murein DD-endopeptidase MepM/ murein hydrolase activator NlpD